MKSKTVCVEKRGVNVTLEVNVTPEVNVTHSDRDEDRSDWDEDCCCG